MTRIMDQLTWIKKFRWVFLSLLISAIFMNGTIAQEPDSSDRLEKRVERYIKWMEKESELWKATARLESLGIKAIPYIKDQIPKLSDIAKVGCAKSLFFLNEEDYALNLLLEVLEKGKDVYARCQAALLFGNYADFDEDVEEKLVFVMENALDSQLKIATAKALWQIARNSKATKILRQFLNTDKEDIKIAAALALAEIGNVEEVKPILSSLKEEPTWRGRLAQSLLNQERSRNYYEKQLQKAAEKTDKDTNKDSNKNNKKNNGNSETLYPTFHEVIQKIKEYHVRGDQIDVKALEDAAIKTIAEKADPHSAFWNEKEWEEFVKSMEKEEYVGIGVYVDKDGSNYIISGLIYSGPAYRAGIRSQDRILEVDGMKTESATMEELIQKIRGPAGTSLKLKIVHRNSQIEQEITVVRENIKIPHVFSKLLPGKIGYILLTQFGQKGAEDIKSEIAKMQKDDLQALILDLRGNTGGWLQIAVDIVDIFLPEGKLVVYSQGRHPVRAPKNNYYTTAKKTICEIPLVVLIDSGSASASEIVAGALQHYKRATIIGQLSYGKGSVQVPLELSSRPNTRLKLTIAMYYLPDGRCIHNEFSSDGKITKRNGIIPDIESFFSQEENLKLEEKNKLQSKKVFTAYLDRFYTTQKNIFEKLAENDLSSSELYPEFENWYQSLNTTASKNDVRRWLRESLRSRIIDERGEEYACDYVEDVVIQKAIISLGKSLKLDLNNISEYKNLNK